MATTTPNFGWPVPTSTDLVKDGATAIEALGDGIDTSMVDLKGGTTGQVLSKTTSADMDFTWVTTDDANAIQNSIVDAKGDIVAASANDTPARLAVGANGETLVADSSTSTGLRYTSNFAGAKNKIINSDFLVNQRAFTTTTTDGTFGFDRWFSNNVDGTVTYSAQTFTAGDDFPEATVEGTNFARLVSTGQTLTTAEARIAQRIEDVRTLADKTITISFWAKASTGTPNVAVNVAQTFGSGGSASVSVAGQKLAITSSWARYNKTFTVPSISGKTIGTGSTLRVNLWTSAGSSRNTDTDSLGIQSVTIDFWGVQVEEGLVATAFQTATGTIQGELAACQRYYFRNTGGETYSHYGIGMSISTTFGYALINLPVTMRVKPTSVDFGNVGITDDVNYQLAASTLVINWGSPSAVQVSVGTAASQVQYRTAYLTNQNNTAGFIGFSAEL